MRQRVMPKFSMDSGWPRACAALSQLVARGTEPQKVKPQGPQVSVQNPTQEHGIIPPPRAQPNTYLVTSGAEVGRTVFLRASIQFLRMPEVMADKV